MVDALSKPKNDVHGDSRAHELCSNAEATTLQLEHHFKNIRSREGEFRRAKLLNLDKEARAKELLHAGEAEALRPPARNAPPSPNASRSASQGSRSNVRGTGDVGQLSRTWSSPGAFVNQSGTSRFAPGASMHRFAASVPHSHHPPVHPGYVGFRSPSSPPRTGPARSASAYGVSMTDSHSDGFSCSPKRPVAFAVPQGDQEDEPIFGAEGNSSAAQHRRSGESPKTIAKLGELMALLGPRYKTVARDKLWEQAARNETPIQRRLRVLKGRQAEFAGAASPCAPRGMALEDPDGKPRAAWLAARSEGRDQRNKG